jgi:hypothetical protein
MLSCIPISRSFIRLNKDISCAVWRAVRHTAEYFASKDCRRLNDFQ